MLEINKYLQSLESEEEGVGKGVDFKEKKEKKLDIPKIGDEVVIEYYSKISGIQLRKFKGICIGIKKNMNKNNIFVTLLNKNNNENLVFKFYLFWNQILSFYSYTSNIKNNNFRKAKLNYLKFK